MMNIYTHMPFIAAFAGKPGYCRFLGTTWTEGCVYVI